MKSRTVIKVGLFIFVAIFFAGLGVYVPQLFAPKPRASDALYASTLLAVPAAPDEKAVLLAGYRHQVLLVNFWATWCAPCVDEMPELSALQAELGTKKINFIGIGIDSAGNMAEFAQKYKIGYPLYVAGMTGTQLATTLGNGTRGLPYTVILNKSGEIVNRYRGRLDMQQLRQDILAIK